MNPLTAAELGECFDLTHSVRYGQLPSVYVEKDPKEYLASKTVEGYFDLLDDLLLSARLPVFTRRAKRPMTTHRKFFFFDAGVYRALRPKGPLDSAEEIDGPAVETLVLYDERGLLAFEVKRSSRYRDSDLATLRHFRADYPMARCFLLYGGKDEYEVDRIRIVPLSKALPRLGTILS